MSTVVNRLRPGFFLDSVALMRISRGLAARDGVEEAALMMGTPANLEIMDEAELLAETGRTAQSGDLVLAVRAHDPSAAEAALDEAERQLARPKAEAKEGRAWRPRTLRSAVARLPGANLALISVPGAYAAAEARKALRRGLHVMIFSDNVSLEEELALKREAAQSGLLVMGPDCGTAIVGGTPLAFANAVPRGEIGVIGASGTGIQEITALIARNGGGVSQAIGVGGRDLSAAIGGLTTFAALDALEGDPSTRCIVLVSKPPAREVAARLAERLAQIDTEVVLCLLGGNALETPGQAKRAATLKEAAELASGRPLGAALPAARPAPNGSISGLFAGGTLCAEAQTILLGAGEAVASNAPVPGAHALGGPDGDSAHRLLDLGDDRFTRGRPHPMIDPAVRDAPLAEALSDGRNGIVLLDLVIGFGAASDPAGHLAAALAGRADGGPDGGPMVIASVTGTDEDPQGRSRQAAILEAAGVLVAPSNADAARLALACLRRES